MHFWGLVYSAFKTTQPLKITRILCGGVMRVDHTAWGMARKQDACSKDEDGVGRGRFSELEAS